ncbi:hypothetical protein CVIRNUC_006105 [Coccomyxa viridis]|uniref:Uncharacterized protein n=1 Tax=Coccomyxa viridis TaxID=1274662 RepID=A0AAV1I9D6_9CHLO|nr:hypothetical protein CVIRNUC_006105 [Coccomyxa viridis]
MACTELEAVAPSPQSALCMPQGVPKALKCTVFHLEHPLLQMSESSKSHEFCVQAPDACTTAMKSKGAAAVEVFIVFIGDTQPKGHLPVKGSFQLSGHKYHHMSNCSRQCTAA